jgi:dethiobiotin synthetase
MTKRFFIAGTDTGVGKTYIACKLLESFNQQGLSTVACKPVASGSEMTKQGLRNEDALHLMQAASIKLPYHEVNPIALQPPIAPHIAAEQVNQKITVEKLITACQPVLNCKADVLVVEGVGGWYVPLNDNETMADFVKALDLSVILVVAIWLGCLNHALLTYHAIRACDVEFQGWVANRIDNDMLAAEENVKTLSNWLGAEKLLSDFSNDL